MVLFRPLELQPGNRGPTGQRLKKLPPTEGGLRIGGEGNKECGAEGTEGMLDIIQVL